MSRLTHAEIEEAHDWWKQLPDFEKGNLSIYMILALYARDWSTKRGVRDPAHPGNAHDEERD